MSDEAMGIVSTDRTATPEFSPEPTARANSQELDDQGTRTQEAAEVLRRLRDDAFDSSNEHLATALGRPVTEVDDWLDGAAAIDGDVLMKARSLASARGINIE